MVGGSIGLTFALSLVIASPLLKSIGMSGIFWLMAVLGVLAIGVTLFLVPAPPPPHPVRMPFRQVLLNADLIRMNVGVLALHASQVAMFMVVPASAGRCRHAAGPALEGLPARGADLLRPDAGADDGRRALRPGAPGAAGLGGADDRRCSCCSRRYRACGR